MAPPVGREKIKNRARSGGGESERTCRQDNGMIKTTASSKLIQRRRLGNHLYDILLERIASFRFQSGGKLDLEELAEELGVSRPPLWEAVCRLEQEGLVDIRPNRGVYLTILSWRAAAEVYQVRASLEGLAARLAVPNVTRAALSEMEYLLEEHRALIESGDWFSFSPMDHRFHAIIYETGGNDVLTEQLLRMKTRLGTLCLDIQPLLPDLYVQHKAVYEALAAGNARRAAAAITAHNEYMEQYCRELRAAEDLAPAVSHAG